MQPLQIVYAVAQIVDALVRNDDHHGERHTADGPRQPQRGLSQPRTDEGAHDLHYARYNLDTTLRDTVGVRIMLEHISQRCRLAGMPRCRREGHKQPPHDQR